MFWLRRCFVNGGDLLSLGGDQERKLFRFRLIQAYTSSERIISSAWCFRLFIWPTQAI